MTTPGRYKMRTIVRLTGFSPSLLRAWERRHEILHPERGPGGQRLYTDDDLKLLRRVRELLEAGHSIGEIAMVGRSRLLQEADALSPQIPSERPVGSEAPAPDSASELTRLQDAVVEGALQMDPARVERVLDEAFALVASERAIHDVIEPSARRVGALWAAGECSVAGEHLASQAFLRRLHKLVEAASSRSAPGPRVACACFPDEHHELGLLILTYHLARRGSKIAYLGPALPFEDVQRLCEATSPDAVLLSVTRRALFLTHRPPLLEMLSRRKPRTLFFVGGAGVPPSDTGLSEAGAILRPPAEDPAATTEAILVHLRNGFPLKH